MAAGNGLVARRQKISTEVEMAVEQHTQSVSKLRRVLEEEFNKKSAVDDLREAIKAVVVSHHPDNESLCVECSNLHIFLNRF